MSAKFSLSKFFKCCRSKQTGKQEAQNVGHTPPVVSETPACAAKPPIALKLSQPQNPSIVASIDGEDCTKVGSSGVTEPQAPLKPPIANAQGTSASPEPGAKQPRLPVSAVQGTPKASSSHAAQAQVSRPVLPVTNAQAGPAEVDPPANEPQPATESVVNQDPSLSQKLWNVAYDLLEKDNAELVDAYRKVMVEVLVNEELKDFKDKKAAGTSAAKVSDVSADRKKIMAEILNKLTDPEVKKATNISAVGASDVPAELEKLRADISAQLRDQTKRQIFMKKLVKEGQAKSATASKIMEGIGDASQSIFSIITTINPVIQNIPQAAPAALPLAGACVGLKVSNRHFLA